MCDQEPLITIIDTPNMDTVLIDDIPPPIPPIPPNTEGNIIHCLNSLLENETNVIQIQNEYNLSQRSIYIIQLLIDSSPQLFHDIAIELSCILKKHSIDISDIPPCIAIIKDIYEMNLHLVCDAFEHITLEDGIEFIETLIIFLVMQNFIPIPTYEKEIFVSIIKSSIDLLENSTNKNQSCCNYISNYISSFLFASQSVVAYSKLSSK